MAALSVTTAGGGYILTADDDDATFETVGDLKLAIQDRHGVRRFQQRLMLGERILEDDATLASLGVPPLGLNLVTQDQFNLILIAVLIMVFQEASYGVIRNLEYAFRLPESCKRDPEYVRQMDNVLNTHLRHTFLFLGLTGVATMVALGFHKPRAVRCTMEEADDQALVQAMAFDPAHVKPIGPYTEALDPCLDPPGPSERPNTKF